MKIYTLDNCSVNIHKRGLSTDITEILETIQKYKLLTYIPNTNQYIFDLNYSAGLRDMILMYNTYLVMALGSISLKVVHHVKLDAIKEFLILEKVDK